MHRRVFDHDIDGGNIALDTGISQDIDRIRLAPVGR